MIKALQKSGCYVGCLEELAWKEGFVSLDKVHEIGREPQDDQLWTVLTQIKDKKLLFYTGDNETTRIK